MPDVKSISLGGGSRILWDPITVGGLTPGGGGGGELRHASYLACSVRCSFGHEACKLKHVCTAISLFTNLL